MQDREVASLFGMEVILLVKVAGENDFIPEVSNESIKGKNPVVIGGGFGEAQRALDEIVLVIHYDQ
jgi:hypothetical protein